MPHPVFLVLIVFAVVAVAPFFLLRAAGTPGSTGTAGADGRDTAGFPPAPPRVLHNAGIAYAVRGPLLFLAFVWGARGEMWPVLITVAGAVFCGLATLQTLRRVLHAPGRGGGEQTSFPTLHAFLAHPYADSNARRVRGLTAGLSVLALSGLLLVEAIGLAYVLRPMLIFPAFWPAAIAGGVLVAALVAVLLSGERAALYAAQAQLGLIYFGLFGATAFLLYLLLAAYPPMPRYGVPALAALVVICIALIVYRRSRYVDTSPIGLPRAGSAAFEVIETRGGKLFRRFNKVLNPALTAILVVIIVFALMGLTAFGWDRLVRDTITTFSGPASSLAHALPGIVLLPIFYPLVDATNWQTLSFLVQRGRTAEQAVHDLRKVVWMLAGETALMVLFAGMFGALAASATAAWRSDTPVEAFSAQITAFHNAIAESVVALLVPGIIVAVFATMVMLCAAIFGTLQRDLVQPSAAAPEHDDMPPSALSAGARHPSTMAVITSLIVIAAFLLAQAVIPVAAIPNVLLAALILFACCQLLMVPLVFRALRAPARAGTNP